MIRHELKYLVVFWGLYIALTALGAALTGFVFSHAGSNVATLANIFAFFAALGGALRTGDGIFPRRLDGSHAQVAADIRAHGLVLALGFAAVALASDLAMSHGLSLAFAHSLPVVSVQHFLLLFGSYVMMALLILAYEQRDGATA